MSQDSQSVKGVKLFTRFNRGNQGKNSSENKSFFFKKQNPTRTPQSEPSERQVSKEQAKKEIVSQEKEDQKKQEDLKENNLEDKKKNEEVTQTKKPEFDRTVKTQEKKGEEPSDAPWTQVGVEGLYASIWVHEDTDLFRYKTYKQYSFYTPNAMSLISSLQASHQILANNEHLRYVFQDYMSFPVTLYYGVLYYVQILRVREYFGQNSDEESKFFRKFERKFDLASLPITGFLFPFFASLAAYDPADSRMTYVIPSFNHMFRASTVDGITDYRLKDDGHVFCQPCIPHLYDWWKSYCVADNLAARYKVKNTFVPFHTAGNNLDLGYTRHAMNAMTAREVRRLAAWGTDSPHPETWTKYTEAHEYWTDSKFATSGPAKATMGQGAVNTISSFMRMDNKMDWFSDCITCAAQHAKFFKYPKTLADVDYSAGMEIGFFGTIRYPVIKNIRIGNATTWFNKLLGDPTGTLEWFEDGIKDFHKLNFRHTMTNCYVAVRYQHNAGDAATNVIDRAAGNTAGGTWPPRWGPWYNKLNNGNDMAHRTTSYFGGSAAEFDVFDKRNILVRNHFYLGKPE